MYIICYGKSPKALATGQKLIDEIGGRFVSAAELITGSFVLAQGETKCAVVMLLPLETAVKAMEKTVTDMTSELPVIAVSPEGRYAAVLRRGSRYYEHGTGEVYSAVVNALGPFCFSGFEGNTGTTGDLSSLVSGYNMSVNDANALEKINNRIQNGGKVNVYTDLPVMFEDSVIDPMTYSLHSYPYDMRDDFVKQYRSAREGRTDPAVFITCTYLGAGNDERNLILVPKILSLGVEIKTKADPGYVRTSVRNSLIKHLLNPEAVARVASTYSAKESEIIKGIAEELGAEVVSFDSGSRAKAKVPLEMTFAPDKRTDTSSALAYLASSEGSLLIRKSASVQGLVFSAAVNRENIILP